MHQIDSIHEFGCSIEPNQLEHGVMLEIVHSTTC